MYGDPFATIGWPKRLAARLRTGLSAHCVDLELEPDGGLIAVVPGWGGSFRARIGCPHRRPQMATVMPGGFELPAQPTAICAGLCAKAMSSTPTRSRCHRMKNAVFAQTAISPCRTQRALFAQTTESTSHSRLAAHVRKRWRETVIWRQRNPTANLQHSTWSGTQPAASCASTARL